MNQIDPSAANGGIHYWLARSWTGYGMLSMGFAMLAVGISSAMKTLGWPGVGLFEAVGGAAMLGCIGLLGVSLLAKITIRATGRSIEIEPRARYSKLAGGLFALGFAAIMLSLAVPASMKARRATQEASRTAFELGDGSIVIELPNTFQLDPATPIRQGIAAVDPVRELTVIAYANHILDLTANTADSYAAQTRATLLTQVPDGTASEVKTVLLGPNESLRQTFAYEESGLRYINTIDVRQLGQWIVDVRFIAPPSRLPDWQSEMDEITASARLASND